MTREKQAGQGWLDRPRNVTRLVRALTLVCLLLLAADLLYSKHGHFGFELWIGFHALFGFVTFFGAVMAGKYLRKLLKRREDYYDR